MPCSTCTQLRKFFYYAMLYLILTIVPSPKVTIKVQNDIVYAGDNVTLLCDVEAKSINVANLSVHITLEGPSGVMVNNAHDINDDVTVTTSVSVMPSNSELYACKAVYTIVNDIPYVTFEEGSDSVMINVTGKHNGKLVMPKLQF